MPDTRDDLAGTPCPRRYCAGALVMVEEGVLNGTHVRYWACGADCGYEMRTIETAGVEPPLFS